MENSQLHPDHLADLRRSGLSAKTIVAAEIMSISLREVSQRLLFAPRYLESAYWIPYLGSDFGRLRGFYTNGKCGKKYLQPKGSEVKLYVPPGVNGFLTDTKIPLYITEGEKKALRAGQEGLCCIGLGGLWNWKRDKKLLPDFATIPLENREVFIVPDNDFRKRQAAYQNRDLLAAVEGLSRALGKLKAKVKVILLPRGTEKIGLDDYLCENSVETLRQLPSVDAAEIRNMPWTENVMELLNEKHAVVMLGGKCRILNEVVEPLFNRPDISFSAVADFCTFYQPLKIQVPDGKGSTKSEPAAKLWLGSKTRRVYQGVVFAPQREVPGFYNLWRGYAVEPVPGDWSLLNRHIFNDLCGKDPVLFNYLMAWCADAVQNPGGDRPGVTVVMRGPKGTGKGLFATSMGKIFGSHFLHLASNHHLTGRFNAHLKDALWVFADEAFWAGDKSSEGLLKQMITEKTFTIEPKGKDAFQVNNHIRLVVASNDTWAVPAGLEERRFFVLNVSGDHARDTKYFGPIFEQMDNGGVEAMLYDLLEWDIGGVDLRTAPNTEGLFEQCIQGMNSVQKWWFERLRAGSQLYDRPMWLEAVITQKLHEDYRRFTTDHGDRYPFMDSVFVRELRKIQPGLLRRQLVGETSVKVPHLQFPTLEACRKRFAQISGVDWGEEAGEELESRDGF